VISKPLRPTARNADRSGAETPHRREPDMTDTITVTDSDVARLAAKIEAADIFADDHLLALSGLFFLAGRATAEGADVEGFMPAFMRFGDIKGESHAPLQLQLNKGLLGGGLLSSFNLGASNQATGGGGNAG